MKKILIAAMIGAISVTAFAGIEDREFDTITLKRVACTDAEYAEFTHDAKTIGEIVNISTRPAEKDAGCTFAVATIKSKRPEQIKK
jgi:hypothetical protein